MYNSSSVEYKIDSLIGSLQVNEIFKDTYRNIDFPVILGLKTGPARLGGGPVGHLNIGNSGGFGSYKNFEVFFDDLTKPIMLGEDKTFGKGHIGFGSFDDIGKVDNIRIWGPSMETNKTEFFSRP